MRQTMLGSRCLPACPPTCVPACLPACVQAADHVGFPAVIKPIHGAASLGVLRVETKDSLAAAYEKVGTCCWCTC